MKSHLCFFKLKIYSQDVFVRLRWSFHFLNSARSCANKFSSRISSPDDKELIWSLNLFKVCEKKITSVLWSCYMLSSNSKSIYYQDSWKETLDSTINRNHSIVKLDGIACWCYGSFAEAKLQNIHGTIIFSKQLHHKAWDLIFSHMLGFLPQVISLLKS